MNSNGYRDMPVIPKCRSIVIETGNILTWSRLKKKPLLPSSAEVLDSVGCLLGKWVEKQDQRMLQYAESLHVHCPKMQQRQVMDDAEREDLRIYLKLTVWLNDYSRGVVREAVERAITSVSTGDCDTVVLSVASDRTPLLEDVKPIWAELEELRAADIVGSLGVADFSPELLEELHDWASEKPRICQIYEKHVCSVLPHYRDFAAANGLQLLSHTDQADPLRASRLNDTLADNFSPADGVGWRPVWLTRVTASYRHRGVVSSWGFVAKAERRGAAAS